MLSFGVILADGRSSRMGEDKAGLVLDGATLLERCRKLLLASGVSQVLISGRPDLVGGFPDIVPNCGPPGAVFSVLAWLRQRHGLDGSLLLFLPVDMPLLERTTLDTLIEASRDVAACHFDGEVFPCSMKATESLHAHLQEAFLQGLEPGGRRSMKAILHWLEARRLPRRPELESQFLNANTPEDWARVKALWSRRAC